MLPEEVLAVARAGASAGCTEALFTLGDKPEARFAQARGELQMLGHDSTIDYLESMCRLVLAETGLVPHVNAGVMTVDEMRRLKAVSGSQGLMLETVADRLSAQGGPHWRSPDKVPAARLAVLDQAGALAIPFTTGLLIGIGETRPERIATLEAIGAAHERYGHVQEVIVQNFRAKPRTPMADAVEPALEDLLWTIAAARLILPPEIAVQAPPNLADAAFPRLLEAGIDDWGGISPVTPDHVNPERPWPALDTLREVTEEAGRRLVARLPAYPAFLDAPWQDAGPRQALLARADAHGMARMDDWAPGQPLPSRLLPPHFTPPSPGRAARGRGLEADIAAIVDRALAGHPLDEAAIVALFAVRGSSVDHVCAAADALRRSERGDNVTFVVNRNINYTNICAYKCSFCAFSKGRGADSLRGAPYDLDLAEVQRRAREAVARGATEVCMQGGIHPAYTGETYLALLRAVKAVEPDLHIHAFSPLEVRHGAQTLGLPLDTYLALLKEAGLGSLPGTAAEILVDAVRARICPDKLSTGEWLETVEAAHRVGLRTTATIMFGHVDGPRDWARHLLAIRDLQARTGGFTEFVPLPFVPMEAPIGLRGESRRGPTFREVRLMHAVARLALNPYLTSIQVSWVKLGAAGAAACLAGGANDLGGTLMDESISRAAGAAHGQEFAPAAMAALIRDLGRVPRQRTTLYGPVEERLQQRARRAPPLEPVVLTPPVRHSKKGAYVD